MLEDEPPFSGAPDVFLNCLASGYHSPRILINLEGKPITALLDTGASRSFIIEGLFPSSTSKPVSVKLGDGTRCNSTNAAELMVHLGPISTKHLFYVLPNLPEQCIIGIDFQSLHDLWIRPSRNHVHIGDTGKFIPFIDTEDAFQLLCSKRMTIPSRSLTFIPLKPVLESNRLYMSQPSEKITHEGILIGRGCHDGSPDFLMALNTTERPLKLGKGDIVGQATSVTVANVSPSAGENSSNNIGEQLDETERQLLLSLLSKYRTDLFINPKNPLGKSNICQHDIVTPEHLCPIAQRLRPTSPADRKIVRTEIDKMLDNNIIRPSSSPWAAPIVLVRKKDGSTRFCVDYRKLNDITIKDVFPLPRSSDLLESFNGSKYFSTLDAASGYWQIPLSKNAIPKTAFTCTEGLFEFLVMPFGLCNAPATYQRMMNCILAGINGITCFAYIDDIIIFSKTFEQHLKDLEEVFQRLISSGLRLKPSKCHFCVDTVHYLGHVVSAKGISPDPKKVEKLHAYPVPRSVQEVRRFLGFAGYYRRFVKNFSLIAEPLFTLLKEDVQFHWNKEQERAFRHIIESISRDAILSHPNFNLPFIVDADASGTGIGGVLSQRIDNKERPIAFISRQLSVAEQKWHIRDKEAYSIIWALESFRHFLLGSKFSVRSDHASLQWLLNAKKGRHGRWALLLMEFAPFQIIHRAGKEHTNVDALSRFSESECMPENATCFTLVPTLKLPSKEELIKAQASDETCMRAMRRIFSSEQDLYRVIDQLIAVNTPIGYRIMIPNTLREHLIRVYHENPSQGHLGVSKTLKKLCEKFHGANLKDTVAQVINECLPCQQRKHRTENHIQFTSKPSTKPWHTVAADFCGPYGSSKAGFRYILVILDHFTKWVELIPTLTQASKEVADAFYDRIICRHGCPSKFLTDQGASFKSHLIESVCSVFHIKKIYSSTYYPQGDGIAERFMRTLNNSLSILSRHHPTDWPTFVPGVAFAYNCSVHASTNQTPFFMNTGRIPFFTEEGWLKEWNGFDPDHSQTTDAHSEYCQSMLETITHAHAHAIRSLEKTYLHMAKLYKPSKPIKIGDRVIVKLTDFERCQFPIRKLAPHWSEPCQVTAILTNGKTFTVDRSGSLEHINRERLIKLPPQTRLEGFSISETSHTEDSVVTHDTAGEDDEDYWTDYQSHSLQRQLATDLSLQLPELLQHINPRTTMSNVSEPSALSHSVLAAHDNSARSSSASVNHSPSVEVNVTNASSAASEASGSSSSYSTMFNFPPSYD